MNEEYYTVEEVAKKFKVTKAAVYKWMRQGDLPFVIVGKERRVTGSALKAFVKPGTPGTPGTPEKPEEEERLALQLATA
jgi:excisionase family DNA binding protein